MPTATTNPIVASAATITGVGVLQVEPKSIDELLVELHQKGLVDDQQLQTRG